MEKNFQYAVGDFVVHASLGLMEVVDKRQMAYSQHEMLIVRKVVSSDDMTWVVNPNRVRSAVDADIVQRLADGIGTYELPGSGKFVVTNEGDLMLQSWMSDDVIVLSVDEALFLRKILQKELS